MIAPERAHGPEEEELPPGAAPYRGPAAAGAWIAASADLEDEGEELLAELGFVYRKKPRRGGLSRYAEGSGS